MIKVKILDRYYEVPNSYNELTVKQLGQIVNCETPLDQLRVFIPDRQLESVNDLQYVYSLAFDYLKELPEAKRPSENTTLNNTVYCFYSDVSRVKTMSVFQMDKLLSSEMEFHEQLAYSAAIILQQLVEPEQTDETAEGLTQYTEQMSIQDTYNILQWFVTEMPKLYENHPTPRLTAQEKQANTSDLERYGMWGAMANLANNDLAKLSYIWQRPIGEVVMMQGYVTAQSEYQKRYSEIMSNQ